jgi:hypothetical protein
MVEWRGVFFSHSDDENILPLQSRSIKQTQAAVHRDSNPHPLEPDEKAELKRTREGRTWEQKSEPGGRLS